MASEMKEKAERVLEDAVYYFWMGVGITLGTVTVVRFLLPKPVKARP